MLFAHPMWLWLLAIAPVLGVMDWRAGGARRAWTALLRSSCIAAAVVALAGPIIPWNDRTAMTVVVLDLNAATAPAIAELRHQLAIAHSTTAVVAFTNRAEVLADSAVLDDPKKLAALSGRLNQPLWSDDPASGGANLADALQLANTLVAGRGHVRLLSYGQNDHGDAAAEAWRLAERGIDITSEPLNLQAGGQSVRVNSVSIPNTARAGQTLRADVTLEANYQGKGSVQLDTGDEAPIVVSGNVVPGLNHLIALVPLRKPGLTTLRATAWANDRPQSTSPAPAGPPMAAVDVGPAASVLLIQDTPDGATVDTGLTAALTELLGPSANVRTVTPPELDAHQLATADAVVVADVPADHLPATTQQQLRQAVLDGAGLLLTGAARSFGPGGYDDSQLAALLPVKMPQQMENIDPSTTLVLIIDTSGSMHGERIELAKEVARLALSHLKPHDKVGIVEFYGGKRWAAPIQSAGNMSVIHRALDRLTAGGGTTLYPAVEEAAFALRNVHTRNKHVLICSDGFVEKAPFSRLVQQMADDGVVVSTAQVAEPDGTPNQMPDIARWGNGHYYTVADRYALPDIWLKQPQVSLTSPLVRTPLALAIGDDSLLVGASADDFGSITGYVRTVAKPTADVLLKTIGGDPLLARWRYGSGFAAALPTQLGSVMTASLQDKPAFGKLLAALLRQIDSGRGSPLRVTARVRPAGIEADITALDVDRAMAAGSLEMTLLDSTGKTARLVTAEAIAPGHWNVLLPGVTAGSYTLRTALAGQVMGQAGVAVPTPATPLLVDHAVLNQLNSFGPLAARSAAALPPEHSIFLDARPWFAIAAALLLLAHVAVRRWPRSHVSQSKRRQAVRSESMKSAVSSPRRSAEPAGVMLGAVAVAALMAGSAVANAATTMPAAAVSSQPIDWDHRIDDALIATGSVDSVAAELTDAPSDSPGVAQAKVRVAIEQGDLSAAMRALQQETAQHPADEVLLRKTAYLQELIGANAAARQTLETARSTTPKSVEATLRLATLDLDENRTADGVSLLGLVARTSPASARRAGMIAYLYGQFATAANCLQVADKDPAVKGTAEMNDLAINLLEGNAALKAGQTDAAKNAFNHAWDQALKPADRLYAQERLIASARQSGTLAALADTWLAEPNLPVDRLLPLATVLSELGRTTQLLDWWKASSTNPQRREAVLSDRFVQEMVDAARSAGRTEDVIAICHELLVQHPADWQWLSANLQALLDAGRNSQADALLDQRLAAVADAPADLARLGKLAKSVGRDEPAVRASHQLTTFGGGPAIEGLLLEASIHKQAGDSAAAAGLLRRAASIAAEHPVGLGQVTSALESAGLDLDAIELLQRSAKRDPTEDTLSRLASLLLKANRPADATPMLQQLAESGSSPAVRGQAAQRLIDATAATAGLEKLIAQLHDRLGHGAGTEQDLSLLVNAELRQNQFDAAVADLQRSPLLDESARLNRLAVLNLRAKKYDAAAGILRKLVTADPRNATDTLERLADTDLKRQRPDEAADVITEIEQRIGHGPTADELMAGVHDRLGQPAAAAADYRRALATTPGNGDDWLLWSTALTKAKQPALARHRLQALCGEAPDDNVFATAVDGLLNMSSSPPVLRVARRDAVLRIARRPHSPILYHVLADLCDELGDTSAQMRATEVSAMISDEERTQRLRDLMDVATQKGDVQTAMDCGRTLLALGDDFPPQLFLSLGEQLLVAGRQPEASRIFARAAQGGDSEIINPRIAELYEKYGYLAAALQTLQPLADRQRTDADFLESNARLNQALGRMNPAFDNYLAAIQVFGRTIVADTTQIKSQPANPDGAAGPVSYNVSEEGAAFARLVGGAIATARSRSQQQALLDGLRSQMDGVLISSANAPGPPNGLITVSVAMRRAAFAFERPDQADAADTAVLARWPDADEFAARALQTRAREGYISLANAFAKAHGLKLSPSLTAANMGATTMPVLPAGGVSLQSAADLLPVLIARGQTQQAKAVLAALPLNAPPPTRNPSASPVRTIIAAAVALKDQEAATQWTLLWMGRPPEPATQPDTIDRPPSTGSTSAAKPATVKRALGGSVPGTRAYSAMIAAAPLLDDAGKTRVVDYFASVVSKSSDARTRGTMLAALQLEAQLPSPRNTRAWAIIALDALNTPHWDPGSLAAHIVLLAPPADRPEMLGRALSKMPADSQLAMLTALVGLASEPLDAATTAAVIDAAGRVPPGQALAWNSWCLNEAQKPVLAALADATVRTAVTGASAPSVLTMAAVAFGIAGDSARADAAVEQAVELMHTPPPVPDASPSSARGVIQLPLPETSGLLRMAISAMSAEARERLLGQVDAASKSQFISQADAVWYPLLQAALLDTTGQRGDALQALRAGFAADPTDPTIARAYLDRLTADGRCAELADKFRDCSIAAATGGYPYRPALSHAMQNLYRWPEVRASADSVLLPSFPVDLASIVARNDNEGLAVALRFLLQQASLNSSGNAIQYAHMPAYGGLNSEYSWLSGDAPPVFSHLNDWPGSLADVLWFLRISPSGASSASKPLAAAVLVNLASNQNVFDQIKEVIEPAIATHTLNQTERQLITAIALQPGCTIPPEWFDELWPAALADDSGLELKRLGQALAAQHLPGASPALAWAGTLSATSTHSQGDEGQNALVSPFEEPRDASLARSIASVCDDDPAAAESRLRRMRDAGRIGVEFVKTAAVWARVAAERGDSAAFRARIDPMLRSWARQRISPSVGYFSPASAATLDLTLTLPTHATDIDRHHALLEVLSPALASLSKTWPGDTDIPQQLALLGHWANTHGDPAAAQTLLAQARELIDRQGISEAQLSVADLATQLSNDDVALSLQRDLLQQRCLPADRIEPVLTALERTHQADLARQLRADAATYCHEPKLLDHAEAQASH